MDKHTAYLKGAEALAEDLLKRAKREGETYYWECMTLDREMNPGWIVSDGLYSGNAGLALFFMELARQNGDDRYLNVAAGTLEWVVEFCESSARHFLAGFTGRASNLWPLMRMAEITGEERYYRMAIDLARTCTAFESSARDVDDLLNGKAGIILPMIHLHAAVAEPFLLETVTRLVDALVDKAQAIFPGLFWDRSYDQIHGLNGFSHGAGGVGYALMELAHYLDDATCYWLAEQAFIYETHWHRQYGFWPDFRKMISNPEDERKFTEALLSENWSFFTVPGRMEAWCHGSPGIGLSRLRAYERTGKEIYREQLQDALDKTANVEGGLTVAYPAMHNHTLCHGRGGNRELFIEASKIAGVESHLHLAQALGDAILEHIQHGTEFVGGYPVTTEGDTSLFMGNAGIAYYLLRLADPDTPSILAPKMKTSLGKEAHSLELTPAGVRQRFVERSFPRSAALLRQLLPAESGDFFRQDWNSGVREFADFLKGCLDRVNEPARARLADALAFETAKLDFDCNAVPCLTSTRQMQHYKILAERDPEQPFTPETLLVLNPSVKLTQSSWAWVSELPPEQSLDIEADTHYAILQPQVDHLAEEELNLFAYLVLDGFAGGHTVAEVSTEVASAFELGSDEELAQVHAMVNRQILEAVRSGILLFG